MNIEKTNKRKNSIITMCLLALPVVSLAQENVAATSSYFSNALFNTLLVTIIILLILVATLSNVLKNISRSEMLSTILKNKADKSKSGGMNSAVVLAFFMLSSLATFAQNKVAPLVKDDGRIGGLDQFTFYLMLTIIFLELIVIYLIIHTIRYLLKTEEIASGAALNRPKEKTILDILGGAVELENEDSILMDHDYDGIKELDNDLPPWWKYGFYLTIIVGVIYLFNYHIFKTAPLQGEEYKIAMKKAEADIAEFMKTSANNVDESTVKQLTDPADLAAGKDLFITNCSPCHGKFGEGTVGPNLTDDYWIHSGGVKDIFKTIKYGWPDKGMKSWKDDFSAMQISQLATFIRNLKGTNPPKPKDKQGDLYVEPIANAAGDSSAVHADSLKVQATADTINKKIK